MSGFYSVRPKARNAIAKPKRAPMENPYSPTSAGFKERNRETRRVTTEGITRVDLGEPVKP